MKSIGTFLSESVWWIVGIAFIALTGFASMQTLRLAHARVEYANVKAEHNQLVADQMTQRAADQQAAREREQDWNAQVAKLTKAKNDEIKTSNARLQSVIDGLRNRPERVTTDASGMPKTAAACTGQTGASLARGDGEFLARFAYDAKKLNIALDKCESQYNTIYQEK